MSTPHVCTRDFDIIDVAIPTGETYEHDGETRDVVCVVPSYVRQFTATVDGMTHEQWSKVDAQFGKAEADRAHGRALESFVDRLRQVAR